MGEIFTAYQTLNKMLNLGLSKEQFLAAEAQWKLDFSERMKFPDALRKDPLKLSADWEVTASLTPRRRAITETTRVSLDQLKTTAQTQMSAKLGKATATPAKTSATTKAATSTKAAPTRTSIKKK